MAIKIIMTVNDQYLVSVKKQFLYYKTIADKAMAQLEPQHLFTAANEDTNSIANIVKHLHGNMMSRFTDFLTTDGEKEWRNRDSEFDNVTYPDKEALVQAWEEGWNCLFNALDSLTSDNLGDIIYIRNEGHTVVEAINRQLAHYPYHIGQIIFYAKQLKQSPWDSLSIPRNKSGEYNNDKFSQEKTIRNFTDAEIKRLNKPE